jgi:ABC-2 type transport system permease protein
MSRYYAFVWAEWRTRLAYRMGTPMAVVASVFSVYAMQAVWRALYQSHAVTAVNGVGEAAAITYVVLTRLFTLIADDTWTLREMMSDIRQGSVVSKMARPADLQAWMFASTIGRHAHTVLFRMIPTALIALLFVRIGAPREPLLFAISLISAYFLAFGIQFCVGALALFWTQVGSFAMLIRLLGNLASGAFVPLWVLPHAVAVVLGILPFAGMYSTPLGLYIGDIRGAAVLSALALQIGWAMALWAGGRLLYAWGRRSAAYAGG